MENYSFFLGLFKGTRAERSHGFKSRVSSANGLGYSACRSLTRGAVPYLLGPFPVHGILNRF